MKSLNKKIFFNPDKTVKEREEFQRLLNEKKKYEISHVTEEGNERRVVLKKGTLTVDGVIVDTYKTPGSIF